MQIYESKEMKAFSNKMKISITKLFHCMADVLMGFLLSFLIILFYLVVLKGFLFVNLLDNW